MSGQIKVNFGSLEAAAGNIKSASNKIDTELADLKRMLQPLVANWSGEAATTYNQLQAQWDNSARDLNQVLASVSTAVANANQAYADGERTNTSRFAQ
jgi:early secretory antigenic target protein ESAT-6